jgi:superfamily I DNA/RNA helicase
MALDTAQQRVVRHHGHLCVAACPGAGKTTVLSHRAGYLLSLDTVSSLATVTYTKDAAEELLARTRKNYPQAQNRLEAGTFHSLAQRQLIAAGQKFQIANEFDSRQLFRKAMSKLGVKESEEEAWLAIQRLKSTLHLPSKGRGRDLELALLECYQALLRKAGKKDFQDLMLDAVRGMLDGRVAPLKVAYMLVDETQDSDDVQLDWVQCHAAAGVQVSIVGDDDQSIYGFRFAAGYGGMKRFVDENGATIITLDKSYRCARSILKAAASLISKNEQRVPKQLRSQSEDDGDVRVVEAANQDEEIEAIGDAIVESGVPEGWAVLARRNSSLIRVESALRSREIPCFIQGGKSLFDQTGPALLCNVLQGVLSGDISAMLNLISASVYANETIVDSLERLVGREASLSIALRHISTLHPVGLEWLVELATRCSEWVEIVRTTRVNGVIRGISEWIDTNVQSPFQKLYLAEGEKVLSSMKCPLQARLMTVRKKEKERSGVALVSLHSSKGLEWPRVWILGCVQGTLPHRGAPVEEERRLMYVGMTRAMNQLIISRPLRDGRDNALEASPFIAEAGLL